MPRIPALLPSLTLLGDSLLLLLAMLLGSPRVALGAAAPAGIVAAVACELLARREHREHAGAEPWRLDGWVVLVATSAVLGLGGTVGLDASGAVWLLVALVAGLGLSSLPNLAPRSRP